MPCAYYSRANGQCVLLRCISLLPSLSARFVGMPECTRLALFCSPFSKAHHPDLPARHQHPASCDCDPDFQACLLCLPTTAPFAGCCPVRLDLHKPSVAHSMSVKWSHKPQAPCSSLPALTNGTGTLPGTMAASSARHPQTCRNDPASLFQGVAHASSLPHWPCCSQTSFCTPVLCLCPVLCLQSPATLQRLATAPIGNPSPLQAAACRDSDNFTTC
jgi:hypothetical protein